MSQKLRICFLCTGNSCRSQMAEGWAHHLISDHVEACSAGTHPQGLNPNAVKVMAEAGVDISGHSSKSIDNVDPASLDVVVTVCGHANENCPVLPAQATRIVHQGFDDPPKLAESAPDEESALNHYRRVRDEIRDWISKLPEAVEA